MSLALVHSRARAGVDAPLVRVEVHLSGGLPVTQIVGLAETSVRESRERVRAALLCARFDFPQRRITLNLAPADLPILPGETRSVVLRENAQWKIVFVDNDHSTVSAFVNQTQRLTYRSVGRHGDRRFDHHVARLNELHDILDDI